MKKTLTSIMVMMAIELSCAAQAATTPEAKAAYKTAKDTAAADYKVAHAKCDALKSNEKDVCVEEAKAARTRAREEAEVAYKDTPKTRAHMRKAVADADYDVAKAKCGSKAGNDKDVCIKEAKAARTAAVADATAGKKVSEARKDASDDKRDAEYKVATEKCNALAGAAKDTCIVDAKAKFGKS